MLSSCSVIFMCSGGSTISSSPETILEIFITLDLYDLIVKRCGQPGAPKKLAQLGKLCVMRADTCSIGVQAMELHCKAGTEGNICTAVQSIYKSRTNVNLNLCPVLLYVERAGQLVCGAYNAQTTRQAGRQAGRSQACAALWRVLQIIKSETCFPTRR